jgi:Putative beta-barrel porin-2, OmpL-like. bbp2
MSSYKCVHLGIALLIAGTAAAQEPSTAPPASAASPWSAGPIEFSGLVDGYFSYNFNHPASKINTWRNFDVNANQFTLNMAKLSMTHSADPVGFTLELAHGRAMEIFHSTEPAGSAYNNLFQAYVSLSPESWKGVQVDFGKFVTSAGSEPTETHLNWNYSRSYLYANGPYYHMGLRASAPINDHFSAGFQLVNGWNNVEDNNSSKTVGLTAAFTSSKINWTNTYYVGNEKTDTEGGIKIKADGVRHFYDTVLAINPTDRVNFLVNFDYGVDKNPMGRDNTFYGYSAAARFVANERVAFSPRYDWYKDRDGFITGQTQTLQEFTLTGDYKMLEGLLARLEYRRDWSNQPFFDYGNQTGNSKSMNTLLAGFVVYFGPAR